MTLNYNTYRSDIDDQCDRSQEYLIKLDEKNLFFNHIYLDTLEIVLKRYMTSFI